MITLPISRDIGTAQEHSPSYQPIFITSTNWLGFKGCLRYAAAEAHCGDEDADSAALPVTLPAGNALLTRDGMKGIYRRIAFAAARAGPVDLLAGERDAAIAAPSTHSLACRADPGPVRGRRGWRRNRTRAALVIVLDRSALRAATSGAERGRGACVVAGALVALSANVHVRQGEACRSMIDGRVYHR